MKLTPLLTIAAVYMGLLGVGFMAFPREIGIGAVPPDAPPALVAYLRVFGGPFLGIAVLDWMTRNAPPSATRQAVLIANAVGFGWDVWGVFGGGARPVAKVFLVVHLLMAAVFAIAARAGSRTASEG